MAYAAISDLTTVGMPAQAVGPLAHQATLNAQLQAASDFVDTFLRNRYGTAAVPLLAWDTTITRATAQIAAYYYLTVKGVNPDSQDWRIAQSGYTEAVAYLDRIQRQQANPNVTVAATGLPGSVQPQLRSSSVVNIANGARARNRGW